MFGSTCYCDGERNTGHATVNERTRVECPCLER
jgi:hypothetical protein